MSAQENQVPSPPTWREYLHARLAPMATKEDLHAMEIKLREEIHAMELRLRTSMRNWLELGFAVLAALITFFGVLNQPPQ